MDSFIFAINSTLPVFLVILSGKLFIKIGLINEQWTKISDKFAFYVALPLVLFQDIANMNIRNAANFKFILFCALTTTVMFLGTWALAFIFLKDKFSVGSFTQGAARSSAAILGIPFIQNIYGNVGMVPMMILAAVPLFNAYSVIILAVSSCYGGKKQKLDINFRRILKTIITNPLIIGILLGFPFCIFGIDITPILKKSIHTIGNTAVPLMLISMGATFKLTDLTEKFKPSLVASIIKLVILPVIFLPLAVYFGIRESSLVAILVMVGSPSAISGYVMAKNMNNDYTLMSNIIVLTTLISSITFTFWIFILKFLQLI